MQFFCVTTLPGVRPTCLRLIDMSACTKLGLCHKLTHEGNKSETKEVCTRVDSEGEHPGLGCTTTSQTDPPPRLNLLGVSWRPWHLQLKLPLSQKGGCARQRLSPNLGRQCLWAELHETGGLSAILASKSAGTLSCKPAHGLRIWKFDTATDLSVLQTKGVNSARTIDGPTYTTRTQQQRPE